MFNKRVTSCLGIIGADHPGPAFAVNEARGEFVGQPRAAIEQLAQQTAGGITLGNIPSSIDAGGFAFQISFDIFKRRLKPFWSMNPLIKIGRGPRRRNVYSNNPDLKSNRGCAGGNIISKPNFCMHIIY